MDGEHHHRRFALDPLIIGLLGIMVGAIVVTTYHCIVTSLSHPEATGHQAQRRSDFEEHDQEIADQARGPIRAGSRLALVEMGLTVICDNREDTREEETCAVCLCEFDNGESVQVLPECMHYFHTACVDAWLYSHANCPMCRAKTGPPADIVLAMAESGGIPAMEHQREAALGGLDLARRSNNEV